MLPQKHVQCGTLDDRQYDNILLVEVTRMLQWDGLEPRQEKSNGVRSAKPGTQSTEALDSSLLTLLLCFIGSHLFKKCMCVCDRVCCFALLEFYNSTRRIWCQSIQQMHLQCF